MPNWCENELTISGPNVQKVLNAIRSEAHDDEDARLLDFDRIIPYPRKFKELDRRAHNYQQKFRAIAKDDPERKTKLESLAAEFGVEPGAPWIKDGFNSGGYEWTWSNWGTKWNAAHVSLTLRNGTDTQTHKQIKCAYCQTVNRTEHLKVLVCQQCGSPLPDEAHQEAFLEFDTAWSPPIPVIEKLASMFPDHDFNLAYYEGGMGFCGQARWSGGREEFHHQDVYSGPRGG
ncbi:MAG: hypothetical protein M5U11_00640 [Anaerolineales bacterium]|nr:hypothetical protein [Anaerolineales bacterium]